MAISRTAVAVGVGALFRRVLCNKLVNWPFFTSRRPENDGNQQMVGRTELALLRALSYRSDYPDVSLADEFAS